MILISFDIEEFDMPLLYKGEISFEEQLNVSRNGLKKILQLLDRYQVKATFFSTVVFAENNKDLIDYILSHGHELASHTYYHSDFEESHLKSSKDKLENLFATEIKGLRMPRMQPVSKEAVFSAGYSYNSSINPTFIPGRYNNLHVSKIAFWENKVLQIPASVSPILRIPLFWLSFHNLPLSIYKFIAKCCLKSTGYLNIYFHPWEFSDISKKEYKLPKYTYRNTNIKMENRFEELIIWLKSNNYEFETLSNFFDKFDK